MMISTAFISYIFVTAFTPGPNNLMALTNAAKFGLRKASIFCLGVLAGFLIDMSLCALLTTVLYASIPKVEPFMKGIGALYMLFLAFTVFRDKPKQKKSEKNFLNPSSMFTGTIMQLVNVKVIIYGITSMTAFVILNTQSSSGVILGVLLLSIVGFLGTFTWAVFGSLFQNIFTKYRKQTNIIMALLLVYCAVMVLR
ncbi:LysE family transporter [Enterococcus xiangfangensis]